MWWVTCFCVNPKIVCRQCLIFLLPLCAFMMSLPAWLQEHRLVKHKGHASWCGWWPPSSRSDEAAQSCQLLAHGWPPGHHWHRHQARQGVPDIYGRCPPSHWQWSSPYQRELLHQNFAKSWLSKLAIEKNWIWTTWQLTNWNRCIAKCPVTACTCSQVSPTLHVNMCFNLNRCTENLKVCTIWSLQFHFFVHVPR